MHLVLVAFVAQIVIVLFTAHEGNIYYESGYGFPLVFLTVRRFPDYFVHKSFDFSVDPVQFLVNIFLAYKILKVCNDAIVSRFKR